MPLRSGVVYHYNVHIVYMAILDRLSDIYAKECVVILEIATETDYLGGVPYQISVIEMWWIYSIRKL